MTVKVYDKDGIIDKIVKTFDVNLSQHYEIYLHPKINRSFVDDEHELVIDSPNYEEASVDFHREHAPFIVKLEKDVQRNVLHVEVVYSNSAHETEVVYERQKVYAGWD